MQNRLQAVLGPHESHYNKDIDQPIKHGNHERKIITMKKLFRSERDRKFTGLCGGLAEYFGIDSTLIRLIAIIVALGSVGTFLFVYVIASLIVPSDRSGSFTDNNHYYY
ncbi:DNA-binding transcriptional activator PspC [compost metagenome]